MEAIRQLLEQNRDWAESREQTDPGCFARLANSQAPHILWIGCCDSRMPAELLTGTEPGDMLVYRNIANIVSMEDASCMAAIEFAVNVLKVDHIIVSGHTNCGGVSTAINRAAENNLDTWLEPLYALHSDHKEDLDHCCDHNEQVRQLSQLNVKQQVANVAKTEAVQQAWKRGQVLSVHGFMYDVASGELSSMGIHLDGKNPELD